jgi:hypothetical protein
LGNLGILVVTLTLNCPFFTMRDHMLVFTHFYRILMS